MSIPRDPFMMLSYINTQLRDTFDSLADLCDREDVSEAEIKEKLASIGYEYNQETNQFK